MASSTAAARPRFRGLALARVLVRRSREAPTPPEGRAAPPPIAADGTSSRPRPRSASCGSPPTSPLGPGWSRTRTRKVPGATHESPRPDRGARGRLPARTRPSRVATTGLAVAALDAYPTDSPQRDQTVDRAIDWMLDHFDVKRANGMEHYNVWSFGYGLQGFAEHLLAHPRIRARTDQGRLQAARREARRVPDARRRLGLPFARRRADVPAVRDVDELHDRRRSSSRSTARRRSGSSCRRGRSTARSRTSSATACPTAPSCTATT
jgi:hypothetical protein